MTGSLKANGEFWIRTRIQKHFLRDDVDFADWKQSHKEIMTDAYFMSLYIDVRHEIMCEIDGLLDASLSPIIGHTQRARAQKEALIEHLTETVNDMMADYDSRRVGCV